ncbi:hypothetical protein LIER_27515 [Lithospermum erythrorhizon]|uniref:Uncharacterized protein n=1 Tax=Lithospermum erythrorhizon TaxID=34254 RepID=A0AAV3RFP4_LITER
MDENRSLGVNSSPNRYRSLEVNHIFDKYRFLDQNHSLDSRFIRQLFSSLWDTRTFLHTFPYLHERDLPHWVLSPIEDMSSGNNDAPATNAPSLGPVSTGRSDPQVTVIDPETLAFFRFWTSAGAKVKYGDLVSCDFHYPPQPTDTSTSPWNSQANVPAQDKGNIPTIIRDSLPVPFTEEHLRNFRGDFSIPSSVDMRLPGEGDQVYEPVLDPAATEAPHYPGWTSLYIESMSYGLRFPFSRFVNGLLVMVNRAPGQIRQWDG